MMTDLSCTKNNILDIVEQFPVFSHKLNQDLSYLDSAATTQRPRCVIEEISDFYSSDNANVYRSVYGICERATARYEASRQAIRHFIHAKRNEEIIFTRSATEAINLVAYSFGELAVTAGDEILISAAEHHSNLVPWQILCEKKDAVLKIIPIKDDGDLDLEAYRGLLSVKTKLVALIHVSNVLGIINPVKEMIALAHQNNTPVLLDSNQAVAHLPVDVQDLDCDFMVFSGHKMYGPTGIGVLYAKQDWLEKMPPYQTGGDMIATVTYKKTEFNDLPHKFEAGTPNTAGVIGLGEAVNFLSRLGMGNVYQHDLELLQYTQLKLATVPGLRIIGKLAGKVGVISFVMDCAHPHDIATILDQDGVAIRAGHHCAMPLMQRYGLAATARASFGVYTTTQDIDKLVAGLMKVCQIFA
jgi:cysteine desulfurase / selenocysteine lyase